MPTDWPYWAFAWSGGLAIGRYLREHPETVVGRRVFDLASGSGLCALAALHVGASAATGADIDPFAIAAIDLNARANGRRVATVGRDVLDDEPPDVDVVLAGDCWYEARLAEREILFHSSVRKVHEPAERDILEEEYRRDRERIAAERDRKLEAARGGAS